MEIAMKIDDESWVNVFCCLEFYDFLSVHASCKHFYNLTTWNQSKPNHYIKSMWKKQCFKICNFIPNKYSCPNWQKLYSELINFNCNSKIDTTGDMINKACEKDFLLVFEMLSSNIKDINKIAESHWIRTYYSPLICAVRWKSKKIANYLLKGSLDYNYTYNNNNNTNNYIMMISDKTSSSGNNVKLTKNKDDYNSNFNCKLIKNLNVSVISSGRTRTPLIAACIWGLFDITKLLLQHPTMTKENINFRTAEKNKTAFYLACERGNWGIVLLMFEDNRVNLSLRDSWYQTPLMKAIYEYDCSLALMLIEAEKNILSKTEKNDNNYNSYNNNIDTNFTAGINTIRMNDININDKRRSLVMDEMENQDTALTYACYYGILEICQALLRYPFMTKSHINFGDCQGKTAFYIACQKKYYDIAQLLLNDQRCDVNIPDCDGITPLIRSILENNDKITEMLINAKKTNRKKVDLTVSDNRLLIPSYWRQRIENVINNLME